MPSTIISRAKAAWGDYTPQERRNVGLYIVGLMLYKVAYEALSGCITALALSVWSGDERYGKLGVLHGVNLLAQCVGSILSAQALHKIGGRNVLLWSVITFAAVPTFLMALDKGTGGGLKGAIHELERHGNWDTKALFPLYCMCGICYGAIELVKRVLPRAIVGKEPDKLRQIDALVHIFYEVSGAGAAFLSSYLVIRLGSMYGMIISPPCFAAAGAMWWGIRSDGLKKRMGQEVVSFWRSVMNGFVDFGLSVSLGVKTIFSQRKLVWLPIGYSVALYTHRYLENGIAPIIAQGFLKSPGYVQILVGGSNTGELLGALAVLGMGRTIPTPLPWLRLDSLLLLLVWIFPYIQPGLQGNESASPLTAWKFAGALIPISMGWAAGDVSLVAYIQSSVSNDDETQQRISSLAAVMSTLYTMYIGIFAIMTPALGKYAETETHRAARRTVSHLGGVQFSVIAFFLLAATFVPPNSISFNPPLEDIRDREIEGDGEKGGNDDSIAESTDGESGVGHNIKAIN